MAATVIIAEELSPATLKELGPDFKILNVDGTDRQALKAALADADAVLIRSATIMDQEMIREASRLKVIARAGVGLDNVDIGAATQAGVMVVNAPTSNIISAAELTVGHILSLARRIPQANASLKGGAWQRSAFTGVELYEKNAGIIGLGRIGALVAERLQAFGMKVLGYDPYVTVQRASQMNIERVELDELLRRSDFVTMHIPKTPETTGMIAEGQFALMKNTAYIVNVARGGLIDEKALDEALRDQEIAGAAIDVFTQEPETAAPFFSRNNIVVTPHLGASTSEAQEKAGVAVARSVRLALSGELVPDAVNVAGGVIAPQVRSGIPLIEKLGRFAAALAGTQNATQQGITDITIKVSGEITQYDVKSLELAALKGVLMDVSSEQVSYVNAPLMAQQRGIETEFITEAASGGGFRNVLCIEALLSDGTKTSVSGTLTGIKQVQKLVKINGLDMELPISDHMLVISYDDKPGAVGIIGEILGRSNTNIASMQVARNEDTRNSQHPAKALALLVLDSPVSQQVIADIRQDLNAVMIRHINLENS